MQTEYAYINTLMRGDLASLHWIESPLKHWSSMKFKEHTELCSVSYASLNFRDVMLATGKLPPDAIPGMYVISVVFIRFSVMKKMLSCNM